MTDTSNNNDIADDEATQLSTRDEISGASSASGVESPQAAVDALTLAKAEAQKNKEAWMRSAADFDNFRKRARKEIEDARKGGREEMLKEFLPVFDNLERAVMMASKATDLKAVSDGIGMILKQFFDAIARVNIVRVPTKGVSFDPSVHEAIQQVESDEPPGTVLSEVQPGYATDGRLVRAALVVVAKPRTAKAPTDAASDSDRDIGGVAVEGSGSGGSESGSQNN